MKHRTHPQTGITLFHTCIHSLACKPCYTPTRPYTQLNAFSPLSLYLSISFSLSYVFVFVSFFFSYGTREVYSKNLHWAAREVWKVFPEICVLPIRLGVWARPLANSGGLSLMNRFKESNVIVLCAYVAFVLVSFPSQPSAWQFMHTNQVQIQTLEQTSLPTSACLQDFVLRVKLS